MDIFKSTNMRLATLLDWNANKVVKRKSGDEKLIRRYARRKLKESCKNEYDTGKMMLCGIRGDNEQN